MKNPLFIILLFAAGCVLPETRTTVVTQHIFSQEDTSFYFSDCEIKSRADSFELARFSKYIKLFNAPNLSKANKGEIRMLFSRWPSYEYCLISLREDGMVTISCVDTTKLEQYDTKKDTIQYSANEKHILHVNNQYRYYTYFGKLDSANWVRQRNPNDIDSLYFSHLKRLEWRNIQDTVTILKTTFYTERHVFSDLLSMVDKVKFWEMEVEREGGATDANSYNIEAFSGRRHHVAMRTTFIEDERFRRLGRKLLEIAKNPDTSVY